MIKLTSVYTAKETVSKVKRWHIECEKIFANDTTNKALISNISKKIFTIQ